MKTWLLTLLLVVLVLGTLEAFWRFQGFQPSIQDDIVLWSLVRRRVRSTDPNCAVILGDSRTQVAIDPQILAEQLNGNQVLIRGRKVDIVGTVCMDQCMVQLDGMPDAEIGDEVVIMGKQNGAEITATEIADDWGTINYEVLCGLASRMPRYYLNAK